MGKSLPHTLTGQGRVVSGGYSLHHGRSKHFVARMWGVILHSSVLATEVIIASLMKAILCLEWLSSRWTCARIDTVDTINPEAADRYCSFSIIYKVLYIPGGAGFLPSTVRIVAAMGCRNCLQADNPANVSASAPG